MKLETQWMGIQLKNPLVASASPLSRNLDSMKRLEDAGIGAIVMYSLFEEQITHDSYQLDHHLSYGSESYGEAVSYFPYAPGYDFGGDAYLTLLEAARNALQVPILASLNGATQGGWTEYAREMELAGASGLELNLYYLAANAEASGEEVENMMLETVRNVASTVSLPVSIKIGPWFTALPHFVRRLVAAGASGVTLFNRFYQTDFDLETLQVTAALELSRSYDLLLPLHWTAILYGQVSADIAVSGGIHCGTDALKAFMAGADAAQMTSELLVHGPERIKGILQEIAGWMEEHEYESIDQMRGSMSLRNVPDSSAFERTNYMRVLGSYKPDPTGWLK